MTAKSNYDILITQSLAMIHFIIILKEKVTILRKTSVMPIERRANKHVLICNGNAATLKDQF